MAEVNGVLFVTEEDKKLIGAWPLELRALFDPAADRELAAKIADDRRAWREVIAERAAAEDSEIPF